MNDVTAPNALVAVPEWYRKFYDKWVAADAHVFALHRNINDYVDGKRMPDEFMLQSEPLSRLPVVLTYDIGSGIGFPQKYHYRNFCKLLGISEADYGANGELLPRDPIGALSLINQALHRYRDSKLEFDGNLPVPEEINEDNWYVVGVIIKHAELLVPNNPASQMSYEDRTVLAIMQNIAQDRFISNCGNPVIMFTENVNLVHESLRSISSRVACIEIPNPSSDKIAAFMELKARTMDIKVEIEPRRIPHLTAALGLIHVEDIFHRAADEGVVVTAELFTEYKDEIMAAEFDGVLEIIEPGARSQKLGGMKAVRRVIEKNIAQPMLAGDFRMVPMGAILMGPPGCGKTALMMSIAAQVGVPVVSFNINQVFNKYVGESEAKLDRALQTIESIGQCIVLMDEISESGIGRQDSGDSGVSTRIFRRILEFTSNPKHRGKIVFVGMTNRPDLLDPALFRDGRLGDKKIPVLAPDREEREDIIRVILDDMQVKHDIKDFTRVIDGTERYTGANLNKLVRTAVEVATEAGRDTITLEDFLVALDSYRPLITRDVQYMIDIAIKYCDDKRLLPVDYHRVWEAQRKSPVQDKEEEPPIPLERKSRGRGRQ